MYYLIRVIFIVLLLLTVIFYIAKSKKFFFVTQKRNAEYFQQLKQDKKKHKKHFITNICFILGIVIISGISFYPFEGYFIQFNTVEDALAYSCIESSDIHVYEADECVFVTADKILSTQIYTLNKVNGKYGMVDFCSSNVYYFEYSNESIDINNFMDQEKLQIGGRIRGKWNKSSNMVFYCADICNGEDPTQFCTTLNGEPMKYMYHSLWGSASEDSINTYYFSIIQQGPPQESIEIENGERKSTYVIK